MTTSQSQLNSPLDLTITNLPKPEARTAMGRWKMFAVLAVCAAPVVASYLTYYVIRPMNSEFLKAKSYGELVQPQRPMPTAAAKRLNGTATTLQSLRGQWLLVSIAGGACAAPCESHLYMQRQLRETLGREKDRLDWVWLISDDAQLTPELQKRMTSADLKGFAALRVNQQDLNRWLDGSPARLYLVDPQGDYMMRFPENMTTEGAAKAKADINRVLRASSFWDTPGRDNIKQADKAPAKP
jgi:cytochrome oxidase Cu insertion factor (SCO1/SenC/PrrC family)